MLKSKYIGPVTAVAAVALSATALAAFDGSGSKAAPVAAPKPAPAARGPVTIGVAGNASLGTILVDSRGRTLYLWRKDWGTRSACSGSCAIAWPPLRATGRPTVGRGLTASLVGTTTRLDGQPQVTYNGHPLYLFAGDQRPGDTSGHGSTGFGGLWDALSPTGNAVTTAASASSGG